MTLLSGFAQEYWQLAIFRFGLGIGQAGCNPLATGIIAEYFESELRGSAMGIYNFGIYTGYSFSFLIGNQINKALSWHWVFFITAIPGFIVAVILLFTVKEPNAVAPSAQEASRSRQEPYETNFQKFMTVSREFLKPTLLMLIIAGSIRNSAGYVWGTNNNTYYRKLDQTKDQISAYLSVIPMVFGIIGSFVGGFVSDNVAKKAEPWKRIWVLVISQISAAPFAAGVLYFPPPFSYYFLIPTYILGEMWVGVLLTIMVEMIPERLRTTGIGFYFFVITNIGGNMQTLVPFVTDYFKNSLNFTENEALRAALYFFYPGAYVLSSVLFLLTLFLIKNDIVNAPPPPPQTSSKGLEDDEKMKFKNRREVQVQSFHRYQKSDNDF
jgi:MFS family permease